MDLSWPKNMSVNDGVEKNNHLGIEFTLHYQSMDDFIKRVVQIGPAGNIFKLRLVVFSGTSG